MFVTCFLGSAIVLLGCIGYNYIVSYITDSKQQIINNKYVEADELSVAYNKKISKQQKLFSAYNNFFFPSLSNLPLPPPKSHKESIIPVKYKDAEHLWEVLYKAKQDNILWNIWNTDRHLDFIGTLGFKDKTRFEIFLVANSLDSNDYESLKAREMLHDEIRDISEKRWALLHAKITIHYFELYKYLFLGFFVVIFPLRYLILAIIWSLKTLRDTN